MSDLELIQKCAQKDKKAWDYFVDSYSRLIYSYINSVLRAKNPGLASEETIQDLFQGIFYSLTKDNFRKLSSFKAKNGCTLASWLRQVSVNYTLDYIRMHKPTVSLDEKIAGDLSLGEIIPDDSIPALDTLATQEKLSGLTQCIKELESDDRYFLELYLNQELKLEIIKDIFKVSRGAVDMRRARIIERLKKCFHSKGFPLD